MADWLIAHGVDESRIYREDRSTSTQENFAYSEEIMAELGLDAGDMFAFVTNDYHIFRAGRIAGTDAACGVAATLPRSAYYDALQLNYLSLIHIYPFCKMIGTGGLRLHDFDIVRIFAVQLGKEQHQTR